MSEAMPNGSPDTVMKVGTLPVTDDPSGEAVEDTTHGVGGMDDPSSAVQSSPLRLPVELILDVACHLSGAYAFGTLASLNVASRALHEGTLPILYETIIWDDRRKNLYGFLGSTRHEQDYGTDLTRPKGYMFTRVAVIHVAEDAEMNARDSARILGGDGQDVKPKTQDFLWPRRVATMFKRARIRTRRETATPDALDESAYQETTCSVEVAGQISSEWLNDILCSLRLKWDTVEGYIFPALKPIQHVSFLSLLSEAARIFKAPTSEKQPDQFWVKDSRNNLFNFKLHPYMQADAMSGETLDAVLEMVNRPQGKRQFARPYLMIIDCNLEIYSLLLPSLKRLLVSQPHSGMLISVVLSETNGDLIETAFLETIETWKDVLAEISEASDGEDVAPSEFDLDVGGNSSLRGANRPLGTIKLRRGPNGQRLLAEFRKLGFRTGSWKQAITYP